MQSRACWIIEVDGAVAWCQENGKRGYALKSGLFPLIKDRETIIKRLDGKVVTLGEKNRTALFYKPIVLNIYVRIHDDTNKKIKGATEICEGRLVNDMVMNLTYLLPTSP